MPKLQEKLRKDEVERFVKIGVLSPTYDSEWAAPSFGVSKKDNFIRLGSDFRVLNLKVVRKSYPLPRIQDTLHSIGSFQWATCLDLSMGYWGMELSKKAKEYCTIICPWGMYTYNVLPMGCVNSGDVFQARMNKLLYDLVCVLIYLDNILIIGGGSYQKHMADIHEVITRL